MSPPVFDEREGECERERAAGGERGREDEPAIGELVDRGLRYQLEEQRRQGEIDDEDVEPAMRLLVLPPDLSGQEAEKDHAEERQSESGDFRHAIRG